MYAFNFHGIGTPGPEIPADERPYWVSADAFEGFVRLMAAHRDKVVITFDDGNRSDLEIAAPILTKHGLTARIFALTGRLETAGYLTPGDLLALRDAGFVIGSHGVDHVDWAAADTATLEKELAASRARLEEILGQPVTEAAIPFGSYRRRVLNALRRTGYDTAWTSDGAATRASGFLRPRLSVQANTALASIEEILKTGLPATRRLRQRLSVAKKTWA